MRDRGLYLARMRIERAAPVPFSINVFSRISVGTIKSQNPRYHRAKLYVLIERLRSSNMHNGAMKSKVTSANVAEANARKMARCQLRSCQCCQLCRDS